MPAMATDTLEFMAVTMTPPLPGENVAVKEYYKTGGTAQTTRRYRTMGRAGFEQEVAVLASSGTPTIANGAQTTGSVVNSGSTDAVGNVSFTTTGTPATGTQATITFANALPAAPRAVYLTAGAWGTTASIPQALSLSTTGFVIAVPVALQASTAHTVYYMVVP